MTRSLMANLGFKPRRYSKPIYLTYGNNRIVKLAPGECSEITQSRCNYKYSSISCLVCPSMYEATVSHKYIIMLSLIPKYRYWTFHTDLRSLKIFFTKSLLNRWSETLPDQDQKLILLIAWICCFLNSWLYSVGGLNCSHSTKLKYCVLQDVINKNS